jgi:hypothetical protein
MSSTIAEVAGTNASQYYTGLLARIAIKVSETFRKLTDDFFSLDSTRCRDYNGTLPLLNSRGDCMYWHLILMRSSARLPQFLTPSAGWFIKALRSDEATHKLESSAYNSMVSFTVRQHRRVQPVLQSNAILLIQLCGQP